MAEKKLDHIAPWARAMIGAARFVFVATADADGRTTVSPKGGTPGFVRVLDERHLAIPDFAGNNLLDSLENIVENPAVGLIFLMPGRPETLRVDGEAVITAAPDVLARWADDGRPPKTAIGVRVRELFFHCPASFQRAELWEPDSWDADASFVEFIRGRACHATSGRRGPPSDRVRQLSVTSVLPPAGTVNVCHVDTADSAPATSSTVRYSAVHAAGVTVWRTYPRCNSSASTIVWNPARIGCSEAGTARSRTPTW